MIKDLAAWRRLREAEEHRALVELTIEESIAIGEALLTSSLLAHARSDGHRPTDLARSLGIAPGARSARGK